MIPFTSSDVLTIAQTLYGEARGEPRPGQVGVAWVIRNRAENPRWWGRSLSGVCKKRFQFSCWNSPHTVLKPLPELYDVALQVLLDEVSDPTGRADHYLRTDWIDRTGWARKNPEKRTTVIGAHTFFRLEI